VSIPLALRPPALRAFRRLAAPALLAMAAAAVVAPPVGAQDAPDPTYPPSFEDPMPLHEGALGPFHRTVTTASREAQAYFDQGIQLMYAFTPERAARSFREAQKRDPGCAMCYWGEAWAWGPYLNGGMSDDDAPRAYAAVQRALEHADGATEVERALIDAMATRYEPTHDEERREELDSIYSEAMADVWRRFPDDLEAGTLYGESLMLLESPRADSWRLDNPLTRRAHRVLEDVLARELTHPGACHLYIHATESTEEPGRAEVCAEYLGDAIPGASHINHMPSHTYNRIGRWNDAVRANVAAWHSDLEARAGGDAFAIYPSHNLHMLLFAASMAGQGAVAIQAGKDYAATVDDGAFYHALTLLRFGRFDEVLALSEPPAAPVQRGLWDFARGYAHLRRRRAPGRGRRHPGGRALPGGGPPGRRHRRPGAGRGDGGRPELRRARAPELLGPALAGCRPPGGGPAGGGRSRLPGVARGPPPERLVADRAGAGPRGPGDGLRGRPGPGPAEGGVAPGRPPGHGVQVLEGC